MSDAKTKLLDVRDYVVVDTETTGLSPQYDKLIEIAALKVRNGDVVDSYQTLINPGMFIPGFITSLTGITDEMVKDAPIIDEVINDYLTFIGDDPILGHNVCFDINFLKQSSDVSNVLFDTKRISMHTLDCPRDLWSVKEECENISGSKYESLHHRALADCETTHFCYEILRPLLIERYGEDPDTEYRRLCNSRKNSSKIDIDGITQTVDQIDDDNPFYGCGICFTGKLSSMTRVQGMQHAVNAGALPQNSVNKKVNYLVVGSFDYVANLEGKKSSKLKKAEDMQLKGKPIQIIDEDYFLENLPSNCK